MAERRHPPVIAVPQPPSIPPGQDLNDPLSQLIRWAKEITPTITKLKGYATASYDSIPAPHQHTHLVGGADEFDEPAAPTTITPDDAADAGEGPGYAREDHVHAVATAAAGTIQPDDAAAEGVATSFSRSDHKHAIATAAPTDIGTANSEGASTSFARADHVHDLTGTTLTTVLGDILTTSSDILTRTGSGVNRLGAGDNGMVARSNTSAGDLAYDHPGGYWGWASLTSGVASNIATITTAGDGETISQWWKINVTCVDASVIQYRNFDVHIHGSNDIGGALSPTFVNTEESNSIPSGTLTVTIDGSVSGDILTLRVTGTTSLTPVSFIVRACLAAKSDDTTTAYVV